MIRLKLFAILLLGSAPGLQALSPFRQINPRNPEKDLEAYIEKRKAEDIYITIPKNYTPIDVRGKSTIQNSLGDGSFRGGIDWDNVKKDICRN